MSRHHLDDRGIEEIASSIDRSRKRHLEVGLLRGDQVHDRLRAQEASASPVLKRSRTTPDSTPPKAKMAMTMAEFKEYMENNTNKRLDGIDNKIGGMQVAIQDNSAKLANHERQIEEIRSEVKALKSDPFPPPRPPSEVAPAWPTVTSTLTKEEDLLFLRARRSLRLWPIRGSSKDELWQSTGIFLGSNLGLEGKLDRTSIEEVSRVSLPSGPGVRDEVLVRFKDAVLRDTVMSSASKLAPFVDAEGRATAGMRLEVPPKLQQSFRVLFKYGQNLRARHGAGTRRHVKFCDTERNLFLNVKLPGDESWSRVSTEVALRGMRARQSITDDQLERRLDITGPLKENPRPRAASTAGPPPPTQASAWMRRSGGSTS